jgi:hypothetical protein
LTAGIERRDQALDIRQEIIDASMLSMLVSAAMLF